MSFRGRMAIQLALAAGLAAGHGFATCVANSEVFGTPLQTGPAMWTYSFSVVNGCDFNNQQFMTNFYVPYFPDANIANITVPGPDTTSTSSTITWTATVEAGNDLFNLPDAGVIDFQVTATPALEGEPGQTAPGVGYYGANGFSFTSTFAPVDGPYAILQYLPPDYTTTTTVFGDPPIPGSPETIAALEGTALPEPNTTVLLALLLCGLPVLRRRFSR